MQALKQFSIPLKRLKIGRHDFVFEIGKDFFRHFEDSPLDSGNLETQLVFDKKSDHIVLDFRTSGTVVTECDRCTARIDLPLESSYQVIIKFGEGQSEDPDVVYIEADAHELNVAGLIYEQIVLAIPIIKTYECELEKPKPCNLEILGILSKSTESAGNSLADALKDLKINKN